MTKTLLEHFDSNTIVKPAGPSGKTTVVAPERRSTVLPRIEWAGEVPTVVSPGRHRFEELERLGQGGMGEVVLAQDHDIERTVAVKRLPAGSELDLVVRFVDEIRTVGQLDHPNIVPVHDVGVDDAGRYYFVMKHLRGQTLEGLIEKLKAGDPQAHQAYPFEVRMQIFLGVLNAIDCAHRQGFIHRDLKPANIMVGPFGEVTVMDWGLAKRVHSAEQPVSVVREATVGRTMVGMVIGTPLYMSPEQTTGAALDERSDLYSLTVLFHELLYLTHYLEGREAIAQIIDGVQTVTPETQGIQRSKFQSYVPAELGWYVQKGFAKDPAKRYQSAKEMIHELQQIIQGRLRVQCTRTMAKRMLFEAMSVVDRHPVIVITGGTLLVSLLLMGAVKSALSLF
jgi:eukaryotic-like serine/threonine-protein kinase